MPSLVVESAEIEAQTFQLTEQSITVGRAPDNTIHIPHPSVSGHHAEMEYLDGDYKLTDLNSTNGTRVNDERIQGEVVLRNGDILQLGNILFRYESENILEAPPLPDLESTLSIGTGSQGRPMGFENFAPFAKVEKKDNTGKMVILACAALSLCGLGFYAFRLLTVGLA